MFRILWCWYSAELLFHFIKWEGVVSLYNDSLFLRPNREFCYGYEKIVFPLTAYLKNDPEFGDFWNMIYDEYLLSKKMILLLSNQSELMENYPEREASIEIRNDIVLPLLRFNNLL
ncbi:MAG: hypothetical protein R2771_08090 [Saprospiraceae bacterium]